MGVLMSEKPELVWVDWPQPNATGLAFSCQARPPALRTEYVRTDIVDAKVARLTAEKQEAEQRGYDAAKEQAAKPYDDKANYAAEQSALWSSSEYGDADEKSKHWDSVEKENRERATAIRAMVRP